MFKLCPQALIYVIFSLAQILIDTFKGLYNTAFIKLVIAILVTLLLNGLCDSGLGIISWIIVFIPFILMTFIVAMLLYIFGLKTTIGSVVPVANTNNTYIIKPQPNIAPTPIPTQTILSSAQTPPFYSTSPAYESFIN